ncbi:MAG: EI24 domain-containing protein [Chitinophagaceae bacterium]|nr:EI24 domain-containing protein [Chitinophagaceae bacterium]MCW5929689.1 EI24 domain-containing protein [Chitinophagaceae bacterium]
MLKEIIIAVQSYFKAHQFIKTNRLWKWILIPGIVYAVLFVVSMYFFGKSASYVIEFLSVKIGLKAWVDNSHSRVLGFFFALGGIMVWLILLLMYFSWFKYIWLIIGSPIFGFLSEKTESMIEGKEHPVTFSGLWTGIKRGVALAFRNLLWQTVYSVALLIVSFVPVVGWISPLAALLTECYYYGFSMLDYSCERQKLTPHQSMEFISRHKGLSIGNGLVFYAMHGLPVVGWVLAPTYAVIAATLSLYKLREEPA